MIKNISLITIVAAISFSACKKSSSSSSGGTTGGAVAVPAIYQKIYGATSITNDGTYLTIKSTGLPDHKSVYYATINSLYEAFGGNTFNKNPSTIASQAYTFKIPINPTVASSHSATPMGPMGIALNGVPLFNQYAAGGVALGNEVVSFDKYWGHPAQAGDYHYHVEPTYLTTVKYSRSALVGFLLDGFPVYGPEENGVAVNEASLDAYHGHNTVTADYPNGIYHYHVTNVAPYINGNGFYGTAGTVTK